MAAPQSVLFMNRVQCLIFEGPSEVFWSRADENFIRFYDFDLQIYTRAVQKGGGGRNLNFFFQFSVHLQIGLTLLGIILVVAVVNPYLMIPTVIIAYVFFKLRQFYLATSRSIKRL